MMRHLLLFLALLCAVLAPARAHKPSDS